MKQLEGGCACGAIRYKLTRRPLIVHACHCRDCQRLTGGPHAINMWIERQCVKTEGAKLKSFKLKAGSGKAHQVFFCGQCATYLWSRYEIVPSDCLFVRAGTLDRPSSVSPDVHIFIRSKLPWVEIPAGVLAFRSLYKIPQVWSEQSLARLAANPKSPAP
jgi:hypothetical protein